MSKIKCFDVAQMVIGSATKDFGEMYKIDENALTHIKQRCMMLDIVSDSNNGVAYEVDVDESTHDITLSLHCEDLDIVGENMFYILVESAKRYRMCVSEDNSENVCVSFVFDGIWLPIEGD